MGGRKQLIAVSSPPAAGLVPGFAAILMVDGPKAMSPRQGEAVIGQVEHMTPQSGGK